MKSGKTKPKANIKPIHSVIKKKSSDLIKMGTYVQGNNVCDQVAIGWFSYVVKGGDGFFFKPQLLTR